MRLIFTYIALLVTTFGFSQNLTGIWRGYFISNASYHLRTGQFVQEKYKYEVQIDNLPNNQIEGVTYSYKTTVFYGKALMQGIFTKSTKVLLLKETKMVEEKHSDQTFVCPMTCYLDYKKSKIDKKETLQGTYTSINSTDGSECGSGTVYLEKVPTTEFEKEDFLIKKENQVIKRKPVDVQNKKSGTQPAIKPGAEDFMISKTTVKPAIKSTETDTTNTVTQTDTSSLPKDTTTQIQTVPIPEVLQKRENVLTQTFIVDSEDVNVEFYDNGQIDGDSISVYHNNQQIITKRMLTYTPITMKVHVEKENPVYEFIVVAENLGAVPPNTALVIISSGSKHYEINIASDELRNAKIVLKYQQPPSKQLNH